MKKATRSRWRITRHRSLSEQHWNESKKKIGRKGKTFEEKKRKGCDFKFTVTIGTAKKRGKNENKMPATGQRKPLLNCPYGVRKGIVTLDQKGKAQ